MTRRNGEPYELIVKNIHHDATSLKKKLAFKNLNQLKEFSSGSRLIYVLSSLKSFWFCFLKS